MWRIRLLPLLLLPFLSPCGSAQTGPITYTVYGVVQLPDGSPASGIIIMISSQASPSLQVIANDMGRYEISGLPRGRYSLSAVNPSDPDQCSDSVEIDATRGAPSRIAVNFFMRSGSRKGLIRSPQAVSVSVAEATQQVPRPAQKALEKANKYRSKKQHGQALASYDRAIEFFPTYFQALAARGHLRLAMGQVAEAAQDFARALELDARYEPALRGSGLCKFQQGSFEDATEDFERAAAEAPGNPMNHLLLGIANSALDRRTAARVSLGKALSLDPVGAVRAHVHLASLWIKQDRPREAIAELEAYLAVAPDAPDAEKWRALAGQLRRKVSGK